MSDKRLEATTAALLQMGHGDFCGEDFGMVADAEATAENVLRAADAAGDTGSMGLNALRDKCYNAAVDNGWYDGSLNPLPERLCLIHSEVSEALEEYRAGRLTNETYYNPDKPTKPEGIPSELADVLIRVLDLCGAEGIDIESAVAEKLAYNATRGYKHGGKLI